MKLITSYLCDKNTPTRDEIEKYRLAIPLALADG